jgi:hypothetical protein
MGCFRQLVEIHLVRQESWVQQEEQVFRWYRRHAKWVPDYKFKQAQLLLRTQPILSSVLTAGLVERISLLNPGSTSAKDQNNNIKRWTRSQQPISVVKRPVFLLPIAEIH